MSTSPVSQRTDFTLDVTGRYVCNGLDEALASADGSLRPDARPFDVIIVGGGSFAAVLANHVFSRDKRRTHRILVLEAGPMSLPEHQQNLPLLNPGEVWGVPWNSDSPQSWNQQFPGLAFTVGGRSLYWGGWSPYFIASELPAAVWPQSVTDDLTTATAQNGGEPYLDQAARQIGTAATNDFISEKLHEELRERLFNGLVSLPVGGPTALVGNRGTPMTAAGKTPDELKNELEAPLAVESKASRPGFFPFNKFSGTPLLIRSTRMASDESAGDDVCKRMMVVPNTHVIRLEMSGRRVVRVHTNQGVIEIPSTGNVILAAGTIESTRLALLTLPNASGLIGRNLMAHLRSNTTIRVPRASFGVALDPTLHPELKELSVSALFVKGIHDHGGGKLGHFHLQITASGVGDLEMNSEAELFKKVPDIDTLDSFRGLTDQWIVLTLRGIGEIEGDKTSPAPKSRITLDTAAPGNFDYGQSRALVRLEPGATDLSLWDAMDQATDALALVFAGGDPAQIQYLSSQNNGVWQSVPPTPEGRRDKLSSTHHESGTLWMGDNAAGSVTDPFGRFHESDNLYAVGPALLPTMGSPNPMLSGVGLARRLGDHLAPPPAIVPPEPGFRYLFNGTAGSFKGWLTAGQGRFVLRDGAIVAYPDPGGNLGLLWYALESFGDFTLRLQFWLDRTDDNSGVFVRFRDPRRRVPDRNNPAISYAYGNAAWVAIDTGYEIQIDEVARPDGADQHRTGAIYNVPVGPAPGQQAFQGTPPLAARTWNDCEIGVHQSAAGDVYTVRLNGQPKTTFTNNDTFRGKSPAADSFSGFLGLQAHTGLVAFQNIRVGA